MKKWIFGILFFILVAFDAIMHLRSMISDYANSKIVFGQNSAIKAILDQANQNGKVSIFDGKKETVLIPSKEQKVGTK